LEMENIGSVPEADFGPETDSRSEAGREFRQARSAPMPKSRQVLPQFSDWQS